MKRQTHKPQSEMSFGNGTENNVGRIGGTLTLLGDPKIKPEKPHTIVCFPGGDVEIARTQDGDYWVHVAIREKLDGRQGSIIGARIDFARRYGDEANELLRREVAAGDVEHIAFLVRPPS